ncbi:MULTISPECIES: UDP-N-acetylmuramoyl-L-alanine--D-glutamate ligase [Sulfurimonas]|uniref:UDP-N-acetylmuramoyl-L-alanine--D-glutamate ligase n=1 Tax=Sulfurimonas TaxID=202746 RepID=UPI00165F36F8|nr:UDP-N-acetylmuramoyl-L-alanine--D-glutamate ligase [Sulfurimonas indica]
MSKLQNFISELAAYKKIAIFGYGVEGKSFHSFAQKYLPRTEIIIVDKAYNDEENYLNRLCDAELIIKSPGISLHNLGIDYDTYNFTSITELFLKHFGSQIIGVTGTKGKSTLVTLIDAMLKNASKKSLLCGNIGLPPLEIIEDIDEKTKVVMELSSHQLHHINYSPHIAILTNLFAEHLDYYKSEADYYQAKFNIFLHQKLEDSFITNIENREKFFNKELVKAEHFYNVFDKKLAYPCTFNIKQGYIHHASLQILEQLREVLDIDASAYKKSLREFQTLPHRLEYVGSVNGVSYINDSIATIPEATMEAVKILKDVDTLILGGYDRGVSYDTLAEFLRASGVKNIICFSDTGKQIYEKIKDVKGEKNIFYLYDLHESVEKAKYVAKNIVLFSPAASSFNMYKNFIERGEAFKNLVKNLKG